MGGALRTAHSAISLEKVHCEIPQSCAIFKCGVPCKFDRYYRHTIGWQGELRGVSLRIVKCRRFEEIIKLNVFKQNGNKTHD